MAREKGINNHYSGKEMGVTKRGTPGVDTPYIPPKGSPCQVTGGQQECPGSDAQTMRTKAWRRGRPENEGGDR